jgi:putative ATPase
MQDKLFLDGPEPHDLQARLGMGAEGAGACAQAPLAERLRPSTLDLDEAVGHENLLGPGQSFRVAFESGRPHSMITWGPPGVGKTALARLMAWAFDAQFLAISGVLGGVKHIREAVEQAQVARRAGRRTIALVDGSRRFNKAVKSWVNQRLGGKVFVQFLVLPRCSKVVKLG